MTPRQNPKAPDHYDRFSRADSIVYAATPTHAQINSDIGQYLQSQRHYSHLLAHDQSASNQLCLGILWIGREEDNAKVFGRP